MALMIAQLGAALVKAADILEAADQAAAAFFNVEEAQSESGKAPGLARLIDPRRWPPPPSNPDFSGVAPAGTAYGAVVGQPFISGPGGESPIHPSDVTQGGLGDCYFLSSLAALANTERGRDLIANNIQRNPDSLTYTVYLYERDASGNLVRVPVVVSPDFPLDSSGNPVFAKAGDSDPATGDQELWVMLYEKAYAKHMGGYAVTQAGWGAAALEILTGVPSQGFVNPVDLPFILESGELLGPGSTKWIPGSVEAGGLTMDEFADRFEAGDAITAGSWPLPKIDEIDIPEIDIEILGLPLLKWDPPAIDVNINPAASISPLYHTDVMGFHEYYVTGVDRSTGEVTIRNPHGWGCAPIIISYAEFQKAFPFVSINSISSPPPVERDFIPIV